MVIEILKAHGALLRLEKIDALLSALLALPQADDFPRHRAVVHRHGAQRSPRSTRWRPSQRCRWMPEWGEERISNMIATRPDWCISRQRVWGVPIIVFYCDRCREPLTDRKILDGVVRLFASIRADIWYRAQRRRTAACRDRVRQVRRTRVQQRERHSGRVVRFRLEPPGGAQRENTASRWPADLYMEGGDQYRGWFQSSLLVGVGLKGGSPYRACALNGWVLDGEGRAMHKSLGNAIEPRGSHQGSRRGDPAAVVGFGGIQRGRALLADHPDAPGRRPTANCATRSAICWAISPISTPRSDAVPARRKCRRWTSGFCCAPKTWWPVAAPGTTSSRSTRSTTRFTISPRWI